MTKTLDFDNIKIMIERDIENIVRDKLNSKTNKVIVVYGARQVGKTTLLNKIFDHSKQVLWLNGDNPNTATIFDNLNPKKAISIIQNSKIVIIDEAQKIRDIGIKLKILFDNFADNVQFVATGSSSFDLANKINEPLTGRKWTYKMYPLTINELVGEFGYVQEKENLNNRLIFGSYPEVVRDGKNAQEIIRGLANDNLYKDIFNMGEIIKTDYLQKILQSLAFQIGSQVSLNEISNLLGIDRKTVDKYISLLEQSFVIFRLKSFSHNLRNELKKSQKFYFYDVGIRNAVINDFRQVDMRQDKGALFENYIISEFQKLKVSSVFSDDYFWRTTSKQEIDYISIKDSQIRAYEIKWNSNVRVRFPNKFCESYNPVSTQVINKENYLDFFVKGLFS